MGPAERIEVAFHSIILSCLVAAFDNWTKDNVNGIRYLETLRISFREISKSLKPGSRAVFEVVLKKDLDMLAKMLEESVVKDGKN